MTRSGGNIVTFYSYKGGTGRSMALANVAWVLASNGAKVLAVDWDLEAPGLHRYFRPFLSDRELTRFESQGVIDFMVDFVDRLSARPAASGERGAEWFKEHADLAKWGKRLLWPSGEDAETEAGGYIDFVPAGRQGAQYAKRVNSFDWAGFYERYNGGAFMDAVRSSLKKYDWVLIDSRTGVSDTAGICTTQLPDILVVCFTLNYQSIDGSAAVAESAKQIRKDLRILPVPTRLDGNEEKLLNAMLGYARRRFQPLLDPSIAQAEYWHEMGVPYFSRYAYCEKLAPFEEQVNVSTSTLPAMETITRYITERRISRMGPLPKDHRKAALKDFEEMPDRTEALAAEPGDPSVGSVRRFLLRFAAGAKRQSLAIVSTFVCFVVTFLFINRSGSPVAPQDLVTRLVDDARKDLGANRRDHAALLLAEASARLDPAAIVGPRSDPGRQIFDALMEFQLFRLGTAQDRGDVVQISPDGRFVASTGPKQVTRLYHFPAAGRFGGVSTVGYYAIAFSPDSRFLATAGRNGSLNVVDTVTQTAVTPNRVWQWDNPDPDSAWVTALAFSPNGDLLAAGTDSGEVLIAKVDPWSVLMPNGSRHLVQSGGVLSLAFSPDSIYLATGGDDSVAHFWTYKQTIPVESLSPLSHPVSSMVFVPKNNPKDPRRLVTASGGSGDGAVTLWTQTSGVPNRSDLYSGGAPFSVAISPRGDSIAIGRANSQTLIGPVGGAVTSSGFGTDVRSLSFSADGKWLLTGNGHGLVQLWDVAKSAELQHISVGHAVKSVALSHDNKYLVIASDNGVYGVFVRIGPDDSMGFSASDAKKLACGQTADAQFKADEWKRYFGSEPLRYTCGASDKSAF